MVQGLEHCCTRDDGRRVVAPTFVAVRHWLDNPPAEAAVSELADSSVNFVVRPWVKAADYWGVYFDVTQKVKESLGENGISIPYPQRDVHMINAETS